VGDPARYEYGDVTSPSGAVVEAVADATGRESLDLPILERAVDTDALDALVARDTDATTRVSFTYDEVDVVVDSDGGIVVWTDDAR
jgi:hypothetical protein